MFKIFIPVVLFICLSTASAADLTVTNLTGAVDATVQKVVETLALGGDYKAVHPASAEGMVIGVDIGLEVTAIPIDDSFKNALALMGNSTKDVPDMIPIPRLNLTKGLPFGFDIGASYLNIKVGGVKVSNMGASLKYAILDGFPSVAIRATYNKGKYFDKIDTTTMGIEALASVPLLFVEPYAGAGIQKGKGEIDKTGLTLPADGLNLSPSVSQTRLFVGLALKLGFLHLSGQADYGSKISTYSGKLSINF